MIDANKRSDHVTTVAHFRSTYVT